MIKFPAWNEFGRLQAVVYSEGNTCKAAQEEELDNSSLVIWRMIKEIGQSEIRVELTSLENLVFFRKSETATAELFLNLFIRRHLSLFRPLSLSLSHSCVS